MGFCPSCGKRTKQGFCPECRPRSEIKVKDIRVKVCTTCGKYFYKNKWISGSLKDGITRTARNLIKNSTEIHPKIPDFKAAPGATVKLDIEAVVNHDVFSIPAQINFTYCDHCSKKQGLYFEGTLQLRNVNDEILDYVESFVRKNNISIAKKTLIETGYDLDISDQRKLQSLGKNLQKNFGGILKTSIRQFTQNRLTSKQVYRVNVYYESPLFKKGDVLKIDKDLFLVTSISKDISAIDLNRDKKRKIDLKNKEFSILAPEKTTVLKIYPTVEVLDPDTYQAVPLQNKKEVKIGEKVKIVNDNGLFYIV